MDLFLNEKVIVPVDVLEEGYCALKSGSLEHIQCLFDRLSNELFKNNVFLRDTDRARCMNEKKGLSRCHQVEWCMPKSVGKDMITLR